MPRPIDHLVVATRDLAATAATWRTLGFAVGGRNRHPWGTENHVAQLAGGFIELIGFGADFVPLPADHPAAPFTAGLDATLARREGLASLALRSDDADRDAADFVAAGIGTGRRLDFGRSAEAADGTRREVAFSLAFAGGAASAGGSPPDDAAAWFFTCQHRRPENFWNPALQRHPNGATAVADVVLVTNRPADHRSTLEALFGPAAVLSVGAGLAVETGGGRLALTTPEEYARRFGAAAAAARDDRDGFAAAIFTVRSLATVDQILAAADFTVERREDCAILPEIGGMAVGFVAETSEAS